MASPDRLCRHCELPLPDESSSWVREGFCCRGCKTVHGVLQAGGLDRYYALRDGAGVPVGELPDEHDLGWIEELRAAPSPRIEIDVQGMHCAGCVWVIEKLFERHGSGSLELNPTLGRAELLVGDDYDLEGFARDVEALGYRLGPVQPLDMFPHTAHVETVAVFDRVPQVDPLKRRMAERLRRDGPTD